MMMNKNDLVNQLYLSCVENYFLAWLSKYYDVSKLYGYEFRSAVDILDDFSKYSTYENYYKISRIQDIAKEYKLVNKMIFSSNAYEALSIIENLDDNSLCLMKVNNLFFEKLPRSPWRDDHFIIVDSDLNWINQYPLSKGSFTYGDYVRSYDNLLLIYQINDLNVVVEDKIIETIKTQDFKLKDIPNKLCDLESAVGILRITRKRLKEYYKDNILAYTVLTEEVDLLDKLYLQIRRDILKGNLNKNFKDSIDSIVFFEKKLCEVV